MSVPRALRWLAIALCAQLLLACALMVMLSASGHPLPDSLARTSIGFVPKFLRATGDDSWGLMVIGYRSAQDCPDCPLYDMFFKDHVKFQYPPTSLLIYDLFPRQMLAPDTCVPIALPGERISKFQLRWDMQRTLTLIARLAVAATILATLLILLHALREESGTPIPRSQVILCALLVGILGAAFYPLSRGYALGQIQVLIDALVAIGLLAYYKKWKSLSGVLFGLCCLIKPQLGILLLWAALRREKQFALAFGTVVAIALSLSIARFRLDDYFDYLRVLQVLSRHGEAYWPNQSVNGLLNRLLGNGSALEFDMTGFPPYSPLIYSLSLLSSIGMIAIAMWPRKSMTSNVPIDLCIAIIAATIASPIAWEHHYGVLLPVFAVALIATFRYRPFGRYSWIILVSSYLAVSSIVIAPWLFFRNAVFGIAASHIFFGGLMLFIVLLRCHRSMPKPSATSTADP